MPDSEIPTRPAPLVPPGPRSLAAAAAAAEWPVERWAEALEVALGSVNAIQRAGHRNAAPLKPGFAEMLQHAENVAVDACPPLQHMILSRLPGSMRDALIMLTVAHDLTEDAGECVEAAHHGTAADLKAVHLAMASLVAFVVSRLTDKEAAALPRNVHSTIKRAVEHIEARFAAEEAA